jgi:2-polyprenyl-3-methyl-5-hydroxy-6-metoxy-1,4-benzoquinol methylase
MGFDAAYERERIKNEDAFYRKMRMKRRLFPLLGELYVGKRAKLRYFRRWFDQLRLPPAARVLEVGSGDGLFCFDAARRRPDLHVTGLELNAIEARVCQRIVDENRIPNLRFVEGSGGGLKDQAWADAFDLIFCLDVLEHIQDDVAVLREIRAALKPGGTALIHVPHRTWTNLDGSISDIPDADAWKVNPGHVRNGYLADELAEKLARAGLHVLRTQRVSGRHIVRALQLHENHPGPLARILLLPWLDHHIRQDLRHEQPQGNGVWAWARRNT